MRANVCQRLANDTLNMFWLLYESLMDRKKSFDRKFSVHLQGKHRSEKEPTKTVSVLKSRSHKQCTINDWCVQQFFFDFLPVFFMFNWFGKVWSSSFLSYQKNPWPSAWLNFGFRNCNKFCQNMPLLLT